METIGKMGEDRLVECLRRIVPGRADVVVGMGDDCAVVRAGRRAPFDWLLKSDPVIQGVHFEPDARPEAIGHKAVGRVLSDMAAMGGEPLWALMDLVAPASVPVERIQGLYRGATALARRCGMAIVGGDTSRGPTLELHVFAVGRVPRGKAILRSQGRAGDLLYVTGALGGSRLGRHLRVEPRLAEGAWLARQGWVTAMMDVSDGLAQDVRRLAAASGTGVVLEASAIPIAAAARRQAGPLSPLEHALADGEDFELLIAVRKPRAAAFERAWARTFRLSCRRIGALTDLRGVVELRQDEGRREVLRVRGYEHFKERKTCVARTHV